MDLRYIYRSFHPKVNQYTFFSVAHETFSKPSPKLTTYSDIKQVSMINEIRKTLCILWDHHGLKLAMNNSRKLVHSWKMEKLTTQWKMGQDRN